MTVTARIGDLIEAPPVRTVVRLEEGREIASEVSSTFVFTPETAAHLTVLAQALASGRGQGYFLHGDFGSGKSHFLAALYAWLSGLASPADLSAAPPALRGLAVDGRRLLPVAVSLVRYRGSAALEEIITREAVEELQRRSAGSTADSVPGTPPGEGATPSRAERHETFIALLDAARQAGFAGVVLLIDELSEFLRSKPTSQALNDDARTLQLLGELAGPQPLWIVAALQESIERTGDVAQAILRKIKDRYPVRLALSTTHIRSVISGRLVRRLPGAQETILKVHELYRSLFPSFEPSAQEFLETYPVHPATIALLDGLGDLFSQHRGIVDFVHARIAGDSSRGIPSILDRPATELLGPDSIYEHFSARLAEYSAFYVYPRHIVPHLDQLIDRLVSEEADRVLARRVVRILVLHRIHPTAREPDCSRLVELAACGLDFRSLEMSARFLAEAILDPLVAESSFLRKSSAADGDPRHAVYALATEEDPARVLGERIRRTVAELEDTDARLLYEPLSTLGESESWPGRAMLERAAERSVSWCLSTRKTVIRLAHPDELDSVIARSRAQVDSFAADFAVVFTTTAAAEGIAAPWITTWVLGRPSTAALGLLKEYLSARLVLAQLKPSSPTDAPLIQPARDALARLEPAAAQAALECFYAGETADPRIRVDPAIRQLRRLDRLLEAMGEVHLAERYPKFRGVAPQRFSPTSRAYQQLLDDFVLPGSISLSEARSRSLAPVIDGLAVPLGLVEVRRGSYVFSPDPRGHPLLVHLFGRVDPAAPVPLTQVLQALEQGPFGLPHETALFLIASLVAGGLLLARRKGRAIPLEFLSLPGVESAEEIGVGELIAEADRALLVEQCPFLFPTPLDGAFGVRQQRDAWKEAVRFRGALESLLPSVASSLERLKGFDSLSGLDLEQVIGRVEALAALRDEIKVSYGAKEGLERFLAAWRSSGLHAADVERVRSLGKFLSRGVDELIFTSHYARHAAVVEAAARSPELAATHGRLLALLDSPAATVVPDGGEAMRAAFAELREQYTERYEAAHARANRKPDLGLDRAGERALALLRSLASVPGLDRPQGLAAWLERLEAAGRALCTRNVREELLRAPVCGCGFRPAGEDGVEPAEGAALRITAFLAAWVRGLQAPAVLEALAARAFALRDAEPAVSARLGRLRGELSSPGLSAAHLPDLLDPDSCRELGLALTMRLDVRTRNLGELIALLAGRRLEPKRLGELFSQWLGETRDGSLIAVEEPGAPSVPGPGQSNALRSAATEGWWAHLHPELFPAGPPEAADLGALAASLELHFPAAAFRSALERMGAPSVAELLSTEPFHVELLTTAWDVLAARFLSPGNESALPGLGGGEVRAADPSVRAAIARRLEALSQAASDLGRELPARMRSRAALEQIARDPWATEALRAICRSRLEEVTALAAAWLATLDPVRAVELLDGPLVLVVDGAPADLWLAVEHPLAAVLERAGGRHTAAWWRLEAEAVTPGALDALLGLGGDPVERLDARGIPYRTLSGDEPEGLLDLAPLPGAGTAAVVRLAVLDRRAHAGEATLVELAGILEGLVLRSLPAVLAGCAAQKRRLVLTTDHGLALARGRLVHGKGGPWERAIYQLEWTP